MIFTESSNTICFECLKHFFINIVNIRLFFYFNFSTTYITCPADPKKTLGIKLPFLVMIIKNLKKYFTFEVQVCHCKILAIVLKSCL